MPSITVKKIASNTIYQIIGKVISMSITIFAVILITRFYGRENYGAFSLMQSWPALFFIIVDFGLNAIAAKELSKDWKDADIIFGNVLIIRLLLSLIVIFISLIILAFLPYSSFLKLGIALSFLMVVTQALYASTNVIFQVKLRYDLSTIGYLGGYLLILILILISSYFKLSIIFVSFSYVIGGFLTFLLNAFFIRKLGVKPTLKLDRKISEYLLVSSLPLGLMFIFSQINFKADSLLISVLPLPSKLGLNNTESVAVYSLPYKVFEVALVVPTFFMNSTYPILVRHSLEGKDRLKDTFFKSLGFLFFSGVFEGILGVLLSKFAVNILGGSQFQDSVLILQILLGGLLIYYLTQPISWFIVTLGYQKYLPYIYLISAAFNVTANYLFIPKYSFYASAVITHLSEFIILILLMITARAAWKKAYA